MRADVAAVPGVVPRRPEFRQNSGELNDFPNLGVQLGQEARGHEDVGFLSTESVAFPSLQRRTFRPCPLLLSTRFGLDHNSAEGHVGIARVLHAHVIYRFHSDREVKIRLACEAARQALALDAGSCIGSVPLPAVAADDEQEGNCTLISNTRKILDTGEV